MKPDLINGTFELVGSLLVWGSIKRLHHDKDVKGIWWPAIAFFDGWGFWNLFFYPYLHQTLSFIGGASMVLANTIWLFQMIYYRRKR